VKTVFFALVFSLSNIGFSQTNQNGLIVPKDFNLDSFNNYCCVFAPPKGFTLYDAPDGNIIGKIIQKQKGEFELNEMFAIKLSNGNTPIYKNFNKGLTDVGYDVFVMSYYEVKNGFVKVFDKNSTYWLKISAIDKANFKLIDWQDFLVENDGKFLGYYANKPGLNLRVKPLKSAKILKTLRGKLFEINLLKESKGNWNKVKVLKYHEYPCKGNLSKEENIEYILEGWIKTVDDNGTPNIWYNARGC